MSLYSNSLEGSRTDMILHHKRVYLEGINNFLYYYWNMFHLYNLELFHQNKFRGIDFSKRNIGFLQDRGNIDDFRILGLFMGRWCIDQLIDYILFNLDNINKSKWFCSNNEAGNMIGIQLSQRMVSAKGIYTHNPVLF